MLTVDQARRALPSGYEISDEELSSVIADAYLIANFAVSDYLNSKQQEDKRDD